MWFLLLYIIFYFHSEAKVLPPVPPHEKTALMARYIMHYSEWVSLATTSTQSKITGFPFVTLKSLSDGPLNNATGVPYLYMTEMDVSGKDVEKDNRVTIMANLAELDYCSAKDLDPQDPRCAKVIVTGKLLKLKKNSPEYAFGLDALYARHPSMKNWPTDHQFYVAKVDMDQICVLDFFGGLKYVTKKEYFDANLTNMINIDADFQRISVITIEGDK
ncbi:protein CREG1 isoform X2 [Cylas formicarius]|nr:protein CREG1 isoform X2 [Cylas formicarius]XP_060524058.1 protein CREG1 isoform X2 [Cylas formicarius]